ncbi:hypothetical protein [Amycolatopsis coloradensis]|uniref:hypothetical protein n=1 Tax=Amycolatopsis coloradensis TaxID=76021 RepID=UPI001177BA5E|nr:hypothetical protein [Amycolatopsis coloradensis]
MAATAAFAALSSTASCSIEKPGTPTQALGSPPQAASSNSGNQDIFAGLDSCEILREVTSSGGYEEHKPETLESDNGCRAKKARYGNVSLYFVDKEGIDKLETSQGTKNPIQVGRETKNEQACADGMVVAEAAAPKLPRGN